MGVKFFIGTPGMPPKKCAPGKNILAMFKHMVSIATNNAILLNEGVPTK